MEQQQSLSASHLYHGLQGNKNKTWTPAIPDSKAAWIAIIPAVVFPLLTYFILMPIMTKKINAACDALER